MTEKQASKKKKKKKLRKLSFTPSNSHSREAQQGISAAMGVGQGKSQASIMKPQPGQKPEARS